MIKFSQFIVEDRTKPEGLHAFDMDETLFAHDHSKLRVHVMDPYGTRVQTLTNQEFNTHKLPPGHRYDFGEFRSSDIFTQSAKPIHRMIAKLKAIQKNGGKTAILTARSDLDDQKKFAHHMAKYGIDIDKTHVYRAGNLEGKPADTKAMVMRDILNKAGHKKVHLYDDSMDNVIIGKLIPAGTGLPQYRNITVEGTEEAKAERYPNRIWDNPVTSNEFVGDIDATNLAFASLDDYSESAPAEEK